MLAGTLQGLFETGGCEWLQEIIQRIHVKGSDRMLIIGSGKYHHRELFGRQRELLVTAVQRFQPGSEIGKANPETLFPSFHLGQPRPVVFNADGQLRPLAPRRYPHRPRRV
jgi:hypothetical protein